jgi:beta-lactam-binding protein with PASTA domain/tRNA A-37 threonylcarbamoyl transferase component Bud32
MSPELGADVLIDGRYRVVEHVGSGGMAEVYRAEDTHLGRPVALKLLYKRFAQDQEFVERFRREASAAAGLQHPNVVSVYDRGEYDGTYYIAMEYCEGVSLKALILREAPLDTRRAISLTKRILLAARFAHRRGVIHRDLKPHNVIIGPDDAEDSVKVADFGIARAGASEITEVGAIMGTAQYLSPEQAQGRPVNEASDLYSIGVVLFEMVTGRPPFDGDSAVAIALKHVNQPAPSPRELRPEIPPELEAVVVRALAKDPAQRYTDADSFIRDLEVVEAHLDSGARSDAQATAAFAPIVEPPVAVATPTTTTPATAPATVQAPAQEAPPVSGAPVEPPPEEERRSRRRRLLAFAALLALALVAVGGYLLLRPETVEMPLVLGQTLDSAKTELEAAGFEVDIDRRTDQAPVDTVFRQVPRAEEQVDEGSTVTVFVSNGPSTAKVPDVIGLAEADARRRLTRARFRPAVQRESSSEVFAGTVIRSDPGPGVAIERGSKVTLVVSSGPEQATVPDVFGQDEDDAVSRLRAAGLSVVVRERSSSEPAGTVVSQAPSAGQQVDQGSQVTLLVSNGKLGEVPAVEGLRQSRAEAEIRDAGFTPSIRTTEVTQPDQDGRVVSQTPASGRSAPRGATIVITVGELAAPEPAPPPAEGTP